MLETRLEYHGNLQAQGTVAVDPNKVSNMHFYEEKIQFMFELTRSSCSRVLPDLTLRKIHTCIALWAYRYVRGPRRNRINHCIDLDNGLTLELDHFRRVSLLYLQLLWR